MMVWPKKNHCIRHLHLRIYFACDLARVYEAGMRDNSSQNNAQIQLKKTGEINNPADSQQGDNITYIVIGRIFFGGYIHSVCDEAEDGSDPEQSSKA